MTAPRTIQPTHSFPYATLTVGVYHAAAGEGLPMHEHTYSHATICHAGEILVRVKGKEIRLGPESMPLDLPANVPHEIEALQPGTVFTNIFATQVP